MSHLSVYLYCIESAAFAVWSIAFVLFVRRQK